MNKETLKTYMKLVIELLCVVNGMATTAGVSPLPFSDNVIAISLYVIVAIIAVIYACWKNHNFTPAAQAVQKVLKGYKEDGFEEGEIEEILEEVIDEAGVDNGI